jgi:hypothetical protein
MDHLDSIRIDFGFQGAQGCDQDRQNRKPLQQCAHLGYKKKGDATFLFGRLDPD